VKENEILYVDVSKTNSKSYKYYLADYDLKVESDGQVLFDQIILINNKEIKIYTDEFSQISKRYPIKLSFGNSSIDVKEYGKTIPLMQINSSILTSVLNNTIYVSGMKEYIDARQLQGISLITKQTANEVFTKSDFSIDVRSHLIKSLGLIILLITLRIVILCKFLSFVDHTKDFSYSSYFARIYSIGTSRNTMFLSFCIDMITLFFVPLIIIILFPYAMVLFALLYCLIFTIFVSISVFNHLIKGCLR
jgi:hypothetical protein